jgi:hypothetical protein
MKIDAKKTVERIEELPERTQLYRSMYRCGGCEQKALESDETGHSTAEVVHHWPVGIIREKFDVLNAPSPYVMVGLGVPMVLGSLVLGWMWGVIVYAIAATPQLWPQLGTEVVDPRFVLAVLVTIALWWLTYRWVKPVLRVRKTVFYRRAHEGSGVHVVEEGRVEPRGENR